MPRQTIDEFRERVARDLRSYTEGLTVERAGDDGESIWLTRVSMDRPDYVVTVSEQGMIGLFEMDDGIGTMTAKSAVVSAIVAKVNSLEASRK